MENIHLCVVYGVKGCKIACSLVQNFRLVTFAAGYIVAQCHRQIYMDGQTDG